MTVTGLTCGCDKLLYPYFKNVSNMQTAIFTFPEIDVALALKFLNEWDDKQINDMLDVFDENMNYNFNPMFQFLYNALEVYDADQITKILEIKLKHREHQN